MKRILLTILFAIVLLALPGFIIKRGPASNEQVIYAFKVTENTGGLDAANCAMYEMIIDATPLQEIACNNDVAEAYADRNWYVTKIIGTVRYQAWGGTEACDVDVDFGGSTTTTFEFGGSDLRSVGDTVTKTTLTDHTIAAGEMIQVRHDTPAADDECAVPGAGPDCDCGTSNAVTAGYIITIYGIPL